MTQRKREVSDGGRRKLRTAAYIRVSEDGSGQEESYELQERYFRKVLLEDPGIEPAGIYADYGRSGVQGKKRPGFQRLLRHCRAGYIDRIICKSISRFARNTADFLEALQVIRESGASIFFEKENLDTGAMAGEFVLTALGAIAQEESQSVSANVRWGFQKRYPKGEAKNLAIYGYRYSGETEVTADGYRLRSLEVVEKEAAVVRRIFEEAAAGHSFRRIAAQLNLEGVPAPEHVWTEKHRRQREGRQAPKGALRDGLYEGWTGRYVGQMIRLERYAGDVLLQKSYSTGFLPRESRKNRGEEPQFFVSGHHPAIVSRELFLKAKEAADRNSELFSNKSGVRNCYPFSGRLVCGFCGRFFHSRNRKHRPIWFCPTAELHNGRNVCRAGWVYEEEMEAALRRAAMTRFGAWLEDGFIRRMTEWLETAMRTAFSGREAMFLERQISMAEGGDRERLWKQRERLEQYSEEFEADLLCRESALSWLRTLPRERGGLQAFFGGLCGEFLKAFVFSIEILPAGRCRVFWCDGTVTETEIGEGEERSNG